MVGLPRNLKLVPDVGKPSSKTRGHTHLELRMVLKTVGFRTRTTESLLCCHKTEFKIKSV